MISQLSTVVAVGESIFLSLIRQICLEATLRLHTGVRDQSRASVQKSINSSLTVTRLCLGTHANDVVLHLLQEFIALIGHPWGFGNKTPLL